MVGAEGFEPPTLWSQTRCATRLRYAPTRPIIPRSDRPSTVHTSLRKTHRLLRTPVRRASILAAVLGGHDDQVSRTVALGATVRGACHRRFPRAVCARRLRW